MSHLGGLLPKIPCDCGAVREGTITLGWVKVEIMLSNENAVTMKRSKHSPVVSGKMGEWPESLGALFIGFDS